MDETETFMAKKRLLDILTLFQKIERTEPEIQKVKDDMMDIKEQQFRFRELFAELVMRDDLNMVLNSIKNEMKELIDQS